MMASWSGEFVDGGTAFYSFEAVKEVRVQRRENVSRRAETGARKEIIRQYYLHVRETRTYRERAND